MAQPKKTTQTVKLLRDGVFYADNQTADKGAEVECTAEVAATLIENGHARAV